MVNRRTIRLVAIDGALVKRARRTHQCDPSAMWGIGQKVAQSARLERASPSATDSNDREPSLNDIGTYNPLIGGDHNRLECGDCSNLSDAKLDKALDGRVRYPGAPRDLPHGGTPSADSAPKTLDLVGYGLHEREYNVRFFARSSVRLTGRATNRTAVYDAPMAKPFTAVMEELLEIFGSLESMESFFGRKPVKSTLGDWARGERDGPGPRLAKAMAAKLDCEVDELLGYRPWKPGFLDQLRTKAEPFKAKGRKSRPSTKDKRRVESAKRILVSLQELTGAVSALIESLERDEDEPEELRAS